MEKSYLCPLFWQHHESEETLRREIQQMHENGVGGFIVESRPHPHYLEDEWWSDLSILIDEAKKRDMEVWIFDDGAYPSGVANGLIRKHFPQYTKKYLACRYVDAIGPMNGSSVLVESWLEEGEKLLAVTAGRRLDGLDLMDMESYVDITEYVENGILYWDIPEGEWRIFILKQTEKGGEEWTKDYLNPLEPEGTRVFLDLIYESHYQHFGEEFGKTVKGFFTDEPRFGNAATYYCRLGTDQVLPWSDTLLTELSEGGLGDFRRLLPALFFESGEKTPDVRFLYMDVVSKRFGKNFVSQMGGWCRDHQVRLIGHFVEENGAHARLGYGPGHFFRAIDGMDASGIDVVNNIYPGRTDGKFFTEFNDYDTSFNHWGLSKMASSAAHLDPKKHGQTVCEAFGAYGWSEGLKTMKWITDAMCVRGVNTIIPHAFSPKEFEDRDCPPHFYARGNNPQFALFHKWAAYANRVCHRISDGLHVAPTAVLYHGEAEWGGEIEPFDKAVKCLMRSQIDCDVIPADILCSSERTEILKGRFAVNKENYQALVIPYAEYLPPTLEKTLKELAKAGILVIFMKGYPKRFYLGGAFQPEGGMFCMDESEIPSFLQEKGIWDIRLDKPCPYLAYYHYRKDGKDYYFLVNEDIYREADLKITFREERSAVWYNAMEDRSYMAEQEKTKDGTSVVSVRLRPYESAFMVFGGEPGEERIDWSLSTKVSLSSDDWTISVKSYEPGSEFEPIALRALKNLSEPKLLPRFSGTIRYEKSFQGKAGKEILVSLGSVYEAVSVYINGKLVGEKICPPYLVEVDSSLVKDGENHLTVEVINTLAKAHHDNRYDRCWVQEPTGLLGPVEILERS